MGKTKQKWKEKPKKPDFVDYSVMTRKDHAVKRKGC
jgi:hypothetical protein